MAPRILILLFVFAFGGCTAMLLGDGSGTRSERSAATISSDGRITAAVKTKMIADKYTEAGRINVDTYSGRVTLRGQVDSYVQKDQAERIARGTAGVVAVTNQIVVKAR